MAVKHEPKKKKTENLFFKKAFKIFIITISFIVFFNYLYLNLLYYYIIINIFTIIILYFNISISFHMAKYFIYIVNLNVFYYAIKRSDYCS